MTVKEQLNKIANDIKRKETMTARMKVTQAEKRCNTIIKKLKELDKLVNSSGAFPCADEFGHEQIPKAIEIIKEVAIGIERQHGEIDGLYEEGHEWSF